MRTFSISTIIRQEEPTCKLTKRIGKSHSEVWAGSLLVFLLLGVRIPWRLCNTNMLHSQGKGMSQAPTSSQQKSPCSAQPTGNSSLAPRTSCGYTHPAGAAKFWLSTVRGRVCVCVRQDRAGAQSSPLWAPLGPLGLLHSPGRGQGHHLTPCEANCLCLLPSPLSLVIAPPLPGTGGQAAMWHPLRAPRGLISSASQVRRWGHLSPSLFSFSHFQWGEQTG